MIDSFRPGTRVRWNWGQGVGRGQVFERFEQPVEQRISGALVRRSGSSRNPAFLIRTDSGEQVLKLASELSRS